MKEEIYRLERKPVAGPSLGENAIAWLRRLSKEINVMDKLEEALDRLAEEILNQGDLLFAQKMKKWRTLQK